MKIFQIVKEDVVKENKLDEIVQYLKGITKTNLFYNIIGEIPNMYPYFHLQLTAEFVTQLQNISSPKQVMLNALENCKVEMDEQVLQHVA